MIQVFKTIENQTVEVTTIEPGCWVHLQAPNEREVEFVAERTKLSYEFLRAALDEEESSRVEIDGEQVLVILDVPLKQVVEEAVRYQTLPLGLIVNPELIVTVCLRESRIIDDFKAQKVKTFGTHKKGRFLLQMLNRVANYYLLYLKEINKAVLAVESTLNRSLRNREVLQMLAFDKALVYISASLKTNDITLKKMMKLELVKRYPDDRELLEDVIIENNQALEMANIYANTLNGTMDAYVSIVSNNLNVVVKRLTSITILLSVPTAVSGFFGMNVPVPYGEHHLAFSGIVGATVLITLAFYYFLSKNDMF